MYQFKYGREKPHVVKISPKSDKIKINFFEIKHIYEATNAVILISMHFTVKPRIWINPGK